MKRKLSDIHEKSWLSTLYDSIDYCPYDTWLTTTSGWKYIVWISEDVMFSVDVVWLWFYVIRFITSHDVTSATIKYWKHPQLWGGSVENYDSVTINKPGTPYWLASQLLRVRVSYVFHNIGYVANSCHLTLFMYDRSWCMERQGLLVLHKEKWCWPDHNVVLQ
jgi:hypothetical protein